MRVEACTFLHRWEEYDAVPERGSERKLFQCVKCGERGWAFGRARPKSKGCAISDRAHLARRTLKKRPPRKWRRRKIRQRC